MTLRRTTHLKIGFNLYDKVLGQRAASNMIGFDSVFNDSYFGYASGRKSKLILKVDGGSIPLAVLSFRCDFGDETACDSVFIGDYRNKRLQEGAEMYIMWNCTHKDLMVNGQPADTITLSLWSGDKRLTTIGTDIKNYGSTLWVVSFVGSPVDTAYFVMEVDTPARQVARTKDHICQKSLLMADLELAYASFCRMNTIKMERCNEDSCRSLGADVSSLAVKISENRRKPVPYETEEFTESRFFRATGRIMCSTASVDDPPGTLRNHPVILNFALSSDPELWKTDMLLQFKMDQSYAIGRAITNYLLPVVGKGLWDFIGLCVMGEFWSKVKAVGMRWLICVIRYLLYMLAFLYQASFFLLFPACVFFLVVWSGSLTGEFEPQGGPSLSPQDDILGDHALWSQLGLSMRVMTIVAVFHVLLAVLCLFYHNIAESFCLSIHSAVNRALTCSTVFGMGFLSLYVSITLMWVLLACIISPVLLGYFVMIAGILLIIRLLVGKLSDLRGMVDHLIQAMCMRCFSVVLQGATSKIPLETDLQKRVREKEQVDLANAAAEMVASYGYVASLDVLGHEQDGTWDDKWKILGIETQEVALVEDDEDTGGLPEDVNEMLEKIYEAQIKLLPKTAVDSMELMPKQLSGTLGKALRGLIDRMQDMRQEFVESLVNEKREHINHVYHDTLKALTDPEYIDLQVTRILNDVISDEIDVKFKQLLNHVLPDSAVSKLRHAVQEAAMSCKSSLRPGEKMSLNDMDRATVEHDMPRLRKTEIAKFFVDVGLYQGVERSSYEVTDRMELRDSMNDVNVCTSTQKLTVPMWATLQDTMNSGRFQSLKRRDNVFLTSPEILSLFDLLTEDSFWWDAFLQMIRDFEIMTDLPAVDFETRVRQVFDRWSEGNGLMPASETANAVLELTSGGIWLQALNALLTSMELCGIYASGVSVAELKYSGFKQKWKKAVGNKGFIEKPRIKGFISELLVDEDKNEGMGIWCEAFSVVLRRLNMTLKLSTLLTFFQEVDQSCDGFLQLEEFSMVIEMICSRGIWQSAYVQFLQKNAIDLPEQVQVKFWNYLNEKELNPGLVPMEKLIGELEPMIMTSGVLSSVLITMCSLIGISSPVSELRFLHAQYDFNCNGFMPYDDLYKLMDKIGRRAMSYARFQSAVTWMGFRFDEGDLYEVFASLDINQDSQLDWPEFRGGVMTLLKQKLPQMILQKIGMSETEMVRRVTGVVFAMVSLFAFVIFSLRSFGGGPVTVAAIQSSFATAIIVASQSESSNGLDVTKCRKAVSGMISQAMGVKSDSSVSS